MSAMADLHILTAIERRIVLYEGAIEALNGLRKDLTSAVSVERAAGLMAPAAAPAPEPTRAAAAAPGDALVIQAEIARLRAENRLLRAQAAARTAKPSASRKRHGVQKPASPTANATPVPAEAPVIAETEGPEKAAKSATPEGAADPETETPRPVHSSESAPKRDEAAPIRHSAIPPAPGVSAEAQIRRQLAKGPMTSGQVIEATRIKESTAYHTLALMRKAGVVEMWVDETDGRNKNRLSVGAGA